jgi:hypothetical protein
MIIEGCRGIELYEFKHQNYEMRIDPNRVPHLNGKYQYLKEPVKIGETQRSPDVVKRVSEILSEIQSGGRSAVMKYAKELDNWDGRDFEMSRAEVEKFTNSLPSDLKKALELGRDQTAAYAKLTVSHIWLILLMKFPLALKSGLSMFQWDVLAHIFLRVAFQFSRVRL